MRNHTNKQTIKLSEREREIDQIEHSSNSIPSKSNVYWSYLIVSNLQVILQLHTHQVFSSKLELQAIKSNLKNSSMQ